MPSKTNPHIFSTRRPGSTRSAAAQEHRDAIAGYSRASGSRFARGLSASSDFQSLVAAETHRRLPSPGEPWKPTAENRRTDPAHSSRSRHFLRGAVFGSLTIAGIAAAAQRLAPPHGPLRRHRGHRAGYASLFRTRGGARSFGIMSMIDPLISTLERADGRSRMTESPSWRRARVPLPWPAVTVIDSSSVAGSTMERSRRASWRRRRVCIPGSVLAKDEVITQVSGRCGTRVDNSLTVYNQLLEIRPYGGGGSDFVLTPVTGWSGWLFGERSGGVLDLIGIQDFRYLSERSYQGGSGGIPFIDDMSNMKRLERILYPRWQRKLRRHPPV